MSKRAEELPISSSFDFSSPPIGCVKFTGEAETYFTNGELHEYALTPDYVYEPETKSWRMQAYVLQHRSTMGREWQSRTVNREKMIRRKAFFDLFKLHRDKQK